MSKYFYVYDNGEETTECMAISHGIRYDRTIKRKEHFREET